MKYDFWDDRTIDYLDDNDSDSTNEYNSTNEYKHSFDLYLYEPTEEDNADCLFRYSYYEVEDAIEKRYNIKTTQVKCCSTRLFDLGYRIFVHYSPDDIFEITLGKCERTSREIRKGHDLCNLIISDEFWHKNEIEYITKYKLVKALNYIINRNKDIDLDCYERYQDGDTEDDLIDRQCYLNKQEELYQNVCDYFSIRICGNYMVVNPFITISEAKFILDNIDKIEYIRDSDINFDSVVGSISSFIDEHTMQGSDYAKFIIDNECKFTKDEIEEYAKQFVNNNR
jgi:hypothetical protein